MREEPHAAAQDASPSVGWERAGEGRGGGEHRGRSATTGGCAGTRGGPTNARPGNSRNEQVTGARSLRWGAPAGTSRDHRRSCPRRCRSRRRLRFLRRQGGEEGRKADPPERFCGASHLSCGAGCGVRPEEARPEGADGMRMRVEESEADGGVAVESPSGSVRWTSSRPHGSRTRPSGNGARSGARPGSSAPCRRPDHPEHSSSPLADRMGRERLPRRRGRGTPCTMGR